MTVAPEIRKAIVQRAIARAKARGIPLDDPEFLTLTEAWIRGEISMLEMREQYLIARPLRQAASRINEPAQDPVSGEEPAIEK